MSDQRSIIEFPNGNRVKALRVPPYMDPAKVVSAFGLPSPRPAIFLTGGASKMSADDMQRTQDIIENGVARFAYEHNAVIFDGGTNAGIMRMIGIARRKAKGGFLLVGTVPHGLVRYPGYDNPNAEAELESHHSHFVLVDGDDWGVESDLIVGMTRAVSGNGDSFGAGLLINGGFVSRHDVYIATSRGEQSLPMLVMEGSGRFADELATASRSGTQGAVSGAVVRSILAGGNIEVVNVQEGATGVYNKLLERFQK